MASSIFDIAPSFETVSIGGKEHKVVGAPLRVVVQLAKESPELIALFMGGGIDAEWLINRAPDAVALLIACGFGEPDNAEVKAKAADLPLDAQIDLLTAIVKATTGGGAGPFLEKLARARALMTVEEEKEQEIKVKLKSVTSSPELSISSSEQDIPEAKYGT